MAIASRCNWHIFDLFVDNAFQQNKSKFHFPLFVYRVCSLIHIPLPNCKLPEPEPKPKHKHKHTMRRILYVYERAIYKTYSISQSIEHKINRKNQNTKSRRRKKRLNRECGQS